MPSNVGNRHARHCLSMDGGSMGWAMARRTTVVEFDEERATAR
jgi:hypothetical protein